jgi:hypothetical protein
MEYSYKNQYPVKALPWTLNLDGYSRNDPSTFTEEEIALAGYKLVPDSPSYDPKTQELMWLGTEWYIQPKQPPNQFEITQQWRLIRQERDQKIKDVEWRYSRHQRHQRLGLAQLDNIALLDQYVQDLANLPQTQTDPFNIIWPQYTGQLDVVVNQ